MTRLTDAMSSMNMKKLLSCLLGACATFSAWPQSLSGTWVFDKAVDFENASVPTPAPFTQSVLVTGTQAALSPNCTVALRQQDYYPGGPFQPLLKSGQDEQAIGAFLSRQFAYRLSDTKVYYSAEAGVPCNKLGSHYLVSEDRLIAIRGGALFYAFKREKPGTAVAGKLPAELAGLKVSPLPFNLDAYVNTCLANMPKRKGVPQVSSKCAASATPYVVARDSKEPLLKLVGAHAFTKGGGRGASDYDNPVGQGLHPVVAVLAPLASVVLVRVDDMEGGDARDAMSGAYLAVKDGKVTGQLNEGCSFGADHVCSTPGDPARFKLLDNGKFVSVK